MFRVNIVWVKEVIYVRRVARWHVQIHHGALVVKMLHCKLNRVVHTDSSVVRLSILMVVLDMFKITWRKMTWSKSLRILMVFGECLVVGSLLRFKTKARSKESLDHRIIGVVVCWLHEIRVMFLKLCVVELVRKSPVRIVHCRHWFISVLHWDAFFEIESVVLCIVSFSRACVLWHFMWTVDYSLLWLERLMHRFNHFL